MSLRKKWIEILYRAATGSKKVRTLLTPLGLLFFLAAIALSVVLTLWIDRLLGFPKLFGSLVNIIVSVPVHAIGLFLVLWSNLHFLKVRGTPVPFNPPPKLVTTGPYAFARNPMVAGVFLVLLGLGFLLGSVTLVFIFTPLGVLLAAWELKAIEEPELEKRLGKEYVEYKKRVPMFFPWMKVRAK
jgi:protein-S-isoprenylcysteine O-methyltransferase Ste14